MVSSALPSFAFRVAQRRGPCVECKSTKLWIVMWNFQSLVYLCVPLSGLTSEILLIIKINQHLWNRTKKPHFFFLLRTTTAVSTSKKGRLEQELPWQSPNPVYHGWQLMVSAVEKRYLHTACTSSPVTPTSAWKQPPFEWVGEILAPSKYFQSGLIQSSKGWRLSADTYMVFWLMMNVVNVAWM